MLQKAKLHGQTEKATVLLLSSIGVEWLIRGMIKWNSCNISMLFLIVERASTATRIQPSWPVCLAICGSVWLYSRNNSIKFWITSYKITGQSNLVQNYRFVKPRTKLQVSQTMYKIVFTNKNFNISIRNDFDLQERFIKKTNV